nr:hypothetical protein [Afifella aestuarii]
MPRSRHPNKEIEAAVRFAETRGWRLEKRQGHCWGRLFCAFADREGCIVSVWSTPRKPQNHAEGIRRAVLRCPHQAVERDEESDCDG